MIEGRVHDVFLALMEVNLSARKKNHLSFSIFVLSPAEAFTIPIPPPTTNTHYMSSVPPPLRIGFLGAAWIAEINGYAILRQAESNCVVTAIASRSQAKADVSVQAWQCVCAVAICDSYHYWFFDAVSFTRCIPTNLQAGDGHQVRCHGCGSKIHSLPGRTRRLPTTG